MFYASNLRAHKTWSSITTALESSLVLAIKESPILHHASIYLTKDDISFVLMTCDDYKDPKTLAAVFADVQACCESTVHAGVVYVRRKEGEVEFLEVQSKLYDTCRDLSTLPFILEAQGTEEVVSTLESFVEEFRLSKAAQTTREARSNEPGPARALDLLASATTSKSQMTRSLRIAMGVLMDVWYSIGQWAEGCASPNAREKSVARLENWGEKEEMEEVVNGLVGFWDHDWVINS